MPQTFVSGHANPVQFQVTGGNMATLNVVSSSMDEEVNWIIVTHSASGGVQARLANILDVNGTVTAFYDLLAPPYLAPPQIYAGVGGILRFYISPANFFNAPVAITKKHWETAVSGGVQFNFSWAVNSLLGAFVRPTA